MQKVSSESYQRSEDFQFDLSGGALCLDLVNTLGDRPRNQSEHLHTYGDLLAWSQQTQILEDSVAQRLAERAQVKPSAAQSAFTRALALREALFRIGSSFAAGQPVPSREFAALNRMIGAMMGESELVPGEHGFQLGRKRSADGLDQMLWSVLLSTIELLTSDRVGDIRQCEAKTCSWLFLDGSRTRRRKWCDMKVCGNRNKARRHYERKKAARGD